MSSFQEIINSNQPTLVDFHATWCGPCKQISPVIQNIGENNEFIMNNKSVINFADMLNFIPDKNIPLNNN